MICALNFQLQSALIDKGEKIEMYKTCHVWLIMCWSMDVLQVASQREPVYIDESGIYCYNGSSVKSLCVYSSDRSVIFHYIDQIQILPFRVLKVLKC